MCFHILLIFFCLSPKYSMLFLDTILFVSSKYVPGKCHVYACEWSTCKAELVREGLGIGEEWFQWSYNSKQARNQSNQNSREYERQNSELFQDSLVLFYVLCVIPSPWVWISECDRLVTAVLYCLTHIYTPTRDRDTSTRDSPAGFKEVSGHVVRGSHG